MSSKRGREDSLSPTQEDGHDEPRRSTSVEGTTHTPKYASLDEPQEVHTTMRCTLPPHRPLSFSTYEEYEKHYQQSHTSRCAEPDCKANFPTAHFLELHLAENHDPIVASKRDAGEKTYACFVEDCDKACQDWKKRRSHMVDKHGYPKNYDFLVVVHGIDRRRSMLRAGVDGDGHRRSSRERGRSASSATEATQSTEATSMSEQASPEEQVQKTEVAVDGDGGEGHLEEANGKNPGVDELTSSFSSLKMVPRSVTFGRRKARGGLAKS